MVPFSVTVMNCFVCHGTFQNNETLLRHVTTNHAYVVVYFCSHNDKDGNPCTRRFSIFNSYRKHRRSHHPDPHVHFDPNAGADASHLLGDDLESNVDSNILAFDPDGNSDGAYVDLSVSLMPDIPTVNMASSEFDNPTSDFKTLIKKDAEKFASFCYSCPDITKKRTIDLINMFTKFQNGPAVYNLRSRLINRLQVLGENQRRISHGLHTISKYCKIHLNICTLITP